MSETNFDGLKFESQLCFPLYACSRAVIKQYKPILDEIGLTYTQYITMMVLWERKKCTVKELGQILYLDSGTLTPLLKKLEEKGLVKRTRSREDERNLIITHTEAGEKLRNYAFRVPAEVGKCIDLTDEESAVLYKVLYKMIKQLEKND